MEITNCDLQSRPQEGAPPPPVRFHRKVEPYAKEDERIFEVHPEVSLQEMAGRALTSGKKTWDGLSERVALLKEAGLDLVKFYQIQAQQPPRTMWFDAAAAARTAPRLARGGARSLPESASVDRGIGGSVPASHASAPQP